MKEKGIKYIGILILMGIYMVGCASGGKYECSECKKIVNKVYYDVADSERHLCKICAEEYYEDSLPFEMYEVGKSNIDEFMGIVESEYDDFGTENEQSDEDVILPTEGIGEEEILIEMQNKYPTADLMVESNEVILDSGKQECTLCFTNGSGSDCVSGNIYNTYIYSMESRKWELRDSQVIPGMEVNKNIGISELMNAYPDCSISLEKSTTAEDGITCISTFKYEGNSDICNYWGMVDIGYIFDADDLAWKETTVSDHGIQEMNWNISGTYAYEKLNTFLFTGNEAVFYLKVDIGEPDFTTNLIEIGYYGNIDKTLAYETELQYKSVPFALVDNEIRIQSFNCIQQVQTDTGIYQYGGDHQIIATLDGMYCETKSGREQIYKIQ